MPSAGAVVPPNILPLRHLQLGVPASQIDTATFIKLETGRSINALNVVHKECAIY